jgi:UDP-glucose 4-epimerase
MTGGLRYIRYHMVVELQNYEVYNIAVGIGSSVLKDISGLKLNYSFAERRVGDIISACADKTRANNFIGWKSELTLKDALYSLWEWKNKIRS